MNESNGVVSIDSIDWLGCPFCGEKPLVEDHGDDGWFVGCDNNDCHFQPSNWCDELFTAACVWNIRKPNN